MILRTKTIGLSVAACLAISHFALLPAEEPRLGPESFDSLREQIRPQPGESRWMDIPWLIDVHEARRRAAAEGKPLFIYSGGGATGIGAC